MSILSSLNKIWLESIQQFWLLCYLNAGNSCICTELSRAKINRHQKSKHEFCHFQSLEQHV